MWKCSVAVSVLTGWLFLAGASPAGAKATASAEPKIERPALPAIQSLELEPATLVLNDGRDGRQVLVWGVTSDGRKFDLTDDATLKAESSPVQIGADRYINPVAAGDATVTVTAAGKEAKLPVKVVSAAVPPIGFASDVMPVLAKVGCNAGTCHGAAKGKNGFKLSLRGYDPDYDYNALVNELQGRRVNRVEPAKSLMLLKPVGAVPHEGRVLFHPGDRQYNIIEQWIKEGLTIESDHAKARPTSVELRPHSIDIDLPARTQRVIVLGHYPDGTSRDVTREAVL